MRLIDADALYEQTVEWEAQALEQVNKYNYKDSRDEWIRWSVVLKERTAFKHDIFDAPTIDAVEVVRCKDCRWYRTAEGCFFSTAEVEPNGFCSHGDTARTAEAITGVEHDSDKTTT